MRGGRNTPSLENTLKSNLLGWHVMYAIKILKHAFKEKDFMKYIDNVIKIKWFFKYAIKY